MILRALCRVVATCSVSLALLADVISPVWFSSVFWETTHPLIVTHVVKLLSLLYTSNKFKESFFGKLSHLSSNLIIITHLSIYFHLMILLNSFSGGSSNSLSTLKTPLKTPLKNPNKANSGNANASKSNHEASTCVHSHIRICIITHKTCLTCGYLYIYFCMYVWIT